MTKLTEAQITALLTGVADRTVRKALVKKGLIEADDFSGVQPVLRTEKGRLIAQQLLIEHRAWFDRMREERGRP